MPAFRSWSKRLIACALLLFFRGVLAAGNPAPAPEPARDSRPPVAPEQILGEQAARTLASALANREFARQRISARIHPASWSVARQGPERWEFVLTRPAGPQAWVSFGLDGSRPEVQTDHARE